MKNILLSVKPQEVERILNGEQTVLVRKTAPKCELPIEVYLYCGKGKIEENYLLLNKDKTAEYFTNLQFQRPIINGKVVAKFTLREKTYIQYINKDGVEHLYNTVHIEHRMCLTDRELADYLKTGKQNQCGGYDGWGWHISDLQILDEPKGLWEFYKENKHPYAPCYDLHKTQQVDCKHCNNCRMSQPPKGFCYVEVGE